VIDGAAFTVTDPVPDAGLAVTVNVVVPVEAEPAMERTSVEVSDGDELLKDRLARVKLPVTPAGNPETVRDPLPEPDPVEPTVTGYVVPDPQQVLAPTVTVAGVRLAEAGALAMTVRNRDAASARNATRSKPLLCAPAAGRRPIACRTPVLGISPKIRADWPVRRGGVMVGPRGLWLAGMRVAMI
jgi:hypothetical protein